MLRFSKRTKKNRYCVITLYAVDRPGVADRIDRPELVNTLLSIFETDFGGPPKNLDIHGPYRIPKGQYVGLRAFRSRLEKFGHEKYSALSGREPDGQSDFASAFAFVVQLSMKVSDDKTISRIAIYWLNDRFDIDQERIASRLHKVFPIDYGYVWSCPESYDPGTEVWIRKTWSGYSSKFDEDAWAWKARVPDVLNGRIRKVYSINFLNETQLSALRSPSLSEPVEIAHGLYVVKQLDALGNGETT